MSKKLFSISYVIQLLPKILLVIFALSFLLLIAVVAPLAVVLSLQTDAVNKMLNCQLVESSQELSICRSLIGALSLDKNLLSQTLLTQTIIFLKMGEIQKARAAAEENVAVLSSSKGANSIELITPINMLAQTFRVNAEYPRARELYNQAIEIAKQNNQKPISLGRVLSQKSVLELYLGHENEARDLAVQMREVYKELAPDDLRHCDVTDLFSDQAETRGDYHLAIELTIRNLSVRERLRNANREEYLDSLTQLTNLYLHSQQFKMAKVEASKLQNCINTAVPCRDAITVNDLLALGEDEIIENRLDDAEADAQRALNITRKLYGKNHPYQGNCLVMLARIYREKKRLTESEALLNDALSIYEKSLGHKNRLIAKALCELGAIRCAAKNYALSEVSYEQSISMTEKTLPHNHPFWAYLYQNYAKLLTQEGKQIRATVLNKKADVILTNARK